VDWVGTSGRNGASGEGEKWHGNVMNSRSDGNYEILWTHSDSIADTILKRDDVPFPSHDYRTHEPEGNLSFCTDRSGTHHPKTNDWGERYGIPGN
jgi:hypothetical protein